MGIIEFQILMRVELKFLFFIKLKQFVSGSKAFFRRNCVMWSLISKSNFESESKAERHTNASLDYFFLNLNWIKNILARYQDFGRKNPEISIDFIIFSISALWWWVFTILSGYGNGQCPLFYIECQEVDWYSGKEGIYFKII